MPASDTDAPEAQGPIAAGIDTARSAEDRYYITALARGLEVLACFRRADKALSNQQIAERCGLPKSTVTRFTYTLTKLGYLVQESGGRYVLGTATLGLGSAMLARLDIRQLARPMMQELAEFSGTTVSIAMRDRLSMIYVEVCRSTAALALALQVGSRMPLAASAIGRAYLVKAPEQERKDIFGRALELDELAHAALREGFEKGLRDYEAYGCTTSFGDWQKDVNGIAVGFMPIGGSQLMSINCGGPASSVSKEFLLEEVRPRLIEIAARLES
ncbi:IclR family transcriptional regulator [Massilia sp. Dwa41.01b]|uniref:IclR family transcriptional regulator n=1 Tax=Massilia sp. Dwa41.01b TaxID=2709302 RepID=UPI0016041606|nr:IclR family transcriptional regulator [Massilia sp. Dwa41.01b]QNA89216.1 IclR family transcriptional regulator [Massilia sp. Dwa41.01b]